MYFISNKIADRLGGKDFDTSKKSYKFMKIKKAKAEAMAECPEIPIIDLGVGEPDLPADPIVVATLAAEACKGENRWYADNGIPAFQEAAARYLQEVYGLQSINPHTELLHGIGAKSILSLLPLCFINPGDITLATVPGYPVIATNTKHLSGEVYNLPLHQQNNFYPDFSSIPDHVLRRAKLLYINYPNNPTGQVATTEFYKRVVDFAYKNDVIVISDASYGAIAFDGYQPLSFLSVDGAKEVGAEIHSLSKAFNMTGWRLAFIAGNAKIIEAYGNIKNNADSGQFMAIQKAGITALNHLEITHANCQRYSRRFDLLIEVLREIGFDAKKPKGTFYCYVPIPRGTRSGIIFENAEEVSNYLIKKSHISTVPWDDAGPFLRLSVTFEAKDYEEEKKIIDELKDRLLKLELVF